LGVLLSGVFLMLFVFLIWVLIGPNTNPPKKMRATDFILARS